MAQRWSFEEDYIVCKYCQEQEYMDIIDWRLDELMARLKQSGYDSRSRFSVERRARDFTYLWRKWDLPKVSKQVKAIYEVLSCEGYDNHRRALQSYIKEKEQSHKIATSNMQDVFAKAPDDLVHMVHIAKGRKFIDVLEDFIQNSGIKPKSRIYRDVGMSQETYSAIRRGKYKTVAVENVYKLCFGLRLKYDDAVILLKSCGYAFREENVLDTVVEYFLMQGPKKQSVQKINGKEQICYMYDTFLIDADLTESKAPELFWGAIKDNNTDDR